MTSIPPLRPTEAGSTDVEPAAVWRGSSPVRTAAAIAAAAALFLAVVVLAGVGRLDGSVPAFLEKALGPEKAEAPMDRTPATGVGVRIHEDGYTVSHWGVSVSVASEDVGGAKWRRHVHGATRETTFGTETIVVNGRKTEEFLTVMKRQGEKTWRWKLASRLYPRLGSDGGVTFLDPTRHRVTSITVDPVRILDGEGKDVTPEGLRWDLEEGDFGWLLTLELDDANLPLPYVIDPAVTHRAAATATTTGATSLVLDVPAGVQPNDLLVAHIARVGNATITMPTDWIAAGGTNNGNSIRQATYYRVAGTSEPGSYTWTWTGTQPAAGGMSAYYGVKASAPLDAVGTATTANNTTTVTAASITTAANDALVLAFFSSNTNSTYSTATGMSERYEIGTTGAASVATDDMTQFAAGPTGSKTSSASTSGRVVGHQVSFKVDNVAPVGSLTDPGSPLAGTVALAATATDADSAVASVLFQRSHANAGTWTDIGTADPTSPYTASFDTTAVADGLYDLRVVITDVASNVTNSMIEDRLVDNTAPVSTTTFPAASGTYNAASWAAGCTTIGLCGTYSDAGSGVSQVQVSLRQGSGNYWNGSGFSSGAEVWNAASLSAGDWSYAFSGTGFPAAGSYTVRVRAVDGAGNVEGPSSRAFTIDPDAPQTTIDSNPSTPTGSTSADFGFSSSEGGSTFECRLDGGAWAACTSPKSHSTLADGTHTFDVRATDAVGNQDASPASYTWLVDTTAPISTTAFPAASGEYNVAGWDAGCATSGLCGTYSDGSGSGVDQLQVSIRRVSTGLYWSGAAFSSASEVLLNAGLSAGSWTRAFPASSFPADGDYTISVFATDDVGNAETPSTRTFHVDATDPTGSLTAPADGAFVTGTLAVSSDSADGSSGVDTAEFQRRPAGGGAWTTIDTDANAPYSVNWDTTALADGDYDLRALTTDAAGNTYTSTPRTVTVDNTAPSAPIVALSESSPYAYVSGTEIFANTDEAGTYDVEATSSDTLSGIDKVRFPGPTDDPASPYSVSYAFGDLADSQTVTAFNGVGLTASSQFTVTPDTAEPAGGSVSYADGYAADGDVVISVDAGTDALSGVVAASALLERRTAPLSGGGCDPFDGAWNAVTSPDTVSSGQCAQFRYRVSDRVGNEAVYTSSNVVKVDLADPSAPVLTLDESSPFAHVVGTEIFVNTNETGSYDVRAATSDAVSGIDRVVFPGGVEDASAPYAATYDLDDLLGIETVTAQDPAGNTASSDFEVTEDVSAPFTTDDTATIGSAWQTAPVTVTLTPTDARSGVAATYYTTDGSIPTTSSDEGTSIDLTTDGVYTIRYFSVDNVGNVEPVRTAFATIRLDQANPSAPAISLNESSPYSYASGAEIFVNSAQTGTFDVSATSSDAGSGIDKVAFPGGIEDATSPYSATYDLTDLSGLQTVTAHDAAGNMASDTFTVTPDTSAPTGGSVSYPDGFDADGTVTITVDAGTDALSGVNAASGVIERRTSALVGGACDPFVGGWSAVPNPDTVPDSTCARYRHRVSDRVGNEAIYTLPTSTVRIDLTAPQTTIDSAPADPSNDASPSFTFSSSEAGSTFECRLDEGAWAACTSPRSYASLADGSHTFQVRATDAAGHADATPASRTWTLDTSAPNTSFDDAPADPSNDDAPAFEFSAGEGGSTFECRLDGGAWGLCSSPETIGLLADSSHTFQVRATDAAGNTDATPASHTWTVDTVAPESSFSVVPADPTNDTTPTFEFTATEPGSTFQCRLDGGTWSACTSPATAGPLADGSHTFEVRATDAAGNQETTPEAYTWVVDAGAPTVSISQPGGFVNSSDADPYTVTATTPDGDVTGVELYRCSDASAACSTGSWVSLGTDATLPYQASWPLDADGNRALRAVATDAASNTSEIVVDVTIDRTVPATTIDSAPSDPSASTSASLAFSASEPGTGFECRLDGGAWSACSSPQGYTGLAEGDHTFDVRATDAAGNVDSTPAAFAWTVDTVAPQTSIDVAPSDPSASPAPSFEFSSSEPGSSFECRLDGGAWGACTSPHGYAGLADGSHTFQVRATDLAGDVDASPASITWTIDATPPGGGLADPGQFLRGTVALTASPSDTGAGIQSVDFQVSPANAGSWGSLGIDTTDPYTVNWDTTALADGAYDLRIVVTDNATNSTPSAVVEDRVVDNTAPEATMDDPGAYLRGNVPLNASATDAGSGVASVAFQRSPAGAGTWTAVAGSWDTTGVADGLYDLRVTVTDSAGNATTSAPVSNRRVDNTRPGLTASTPADGSTLPSAGSLAVIASENLAGIVGATIDGAAAPAPVVADNTVTYTQSFSAGPHTLAGELEDLAGNRQPIRVHFTTWSTVTADYPYVEKNSNAGQAMALRSTSNTTTATVPAGAWAGAPAGDWLVVRIDPAPASGTTNGFEPASEILDVTAYWALNGSPVTSFSLPLEIEVDNAASHVVPAVFESGAWHPIAQVPGTGLPAAWADGFELDGTNVRIFTRHLSLFTLLEDVQTPAMPGGFKGTVSGGSFSLSWNAAADNSGLISAYRIYASNALVKTVDGSQRSVGMGTFKLTDTRSFQVAAVDAADNLGTRSGALKVVPKVAKLTLAAAKTALKKRGFKVGRITYRTSSVPKGRVIKGVVSGLKPAGSKVALSVSKGQSGSSRPATTTSPPIPPPSTPTTPGTAPVPPPARSVTSAAPPTTTAEESSEPKPGHVLPLVDPGITGLSDLRQEFGFGLLAAAFSIAVAAGLRARRPAVQGPPRDPDQLLLWDQRIIRSIRSFLRIP